MTDAWRPLALLALSCLAACGGHERSTLASASDIASLPNTPGVTPFIAFIPLTGKSLSAVTSISYVIEPRPGAVSNPVSVQFSIAGLRGRGYVTADTVTLPVFGLYAGYANQVSIQLTFTDASRQFIARVLSTAAYTDPNGIYDQPTILKKRPAGSRLGFDFIAVKSSLGTPVIVDTDGELRWVAVGVDSSSSSILNDNGFDIGGSTDTTFYRLELDGTVTKTTLASPEYIRFHHNIDRGRDGLLAELDTATDTESTISALTPTGGFGKEWDLARLLADYMLAQGDDPSAFVRPGTDWFHSNDAVYDARDNSLIVSSRENFLIKLDYDSGAIIWILGDPTKYWYTFPSLRAKALTVVGTGLYPIGQHAVSFTNDGLLMLFNNGFPSVSQPVGAPTGSSRAYSAVSAYRIDPVARTAEEAWRFDYGQTVFTPICGSAYQAADDSLIVDYPAVDSSSHMRLVGLDDQRAVVFDLQYASPGGCTAGWNAAPIHLEQMQFR